MGKAALTVHGTFEVQSAQLVEDDAGEDVAKENNQENGSANAPDASKDNGGSDAKRKNEEADKEPAKKRRKCKRTDLVITSVGCPGLGADELAKIRDVEVKM